MWHALGYENLGSILDEISEREAIFKAWSYESIYKVFFVK
jgi:hypothetical protein